MMISPATIWTFGDFMVVGCLSAIAAWGCHLKHGAGDIPAIPDGSFLGENHGEMGGKFPLGGSSHEK